jgi:CDP-diacylglycerol--serine O-phosphatidyltransferase
VLSIGTVCYLASLPFGWFSYREYERRHAATPPSEEASLPGEHKPSKADEPERPARLN